MSRYLSRLGHCQVCGDPVLWCRTSKGQPEALQLHPSADGYVLEEEGFTHVYDNHEHAMNDLLRQGFPFDAIKLYELHYCGEDDET